MNATFGKLRQAELSLHPGLNLIYAPNESGKSTWSAFMRTMLYGLPARERGALADKNRYAPWDGSAMQGRIDVTDGDMRYTIARSTLRANSPMGEFSCTYSDTATAVPDVTGQNVGETLLGIPREIFERSAFIHQNALAVDQDAELERRIAALITTGEEDTSYTEAYERLKKQLNRRKHNKSGLIPTLEQEIDALDDSLAELTNLSGKVEILQDHLCDLQSQLQMLDQQNKQWAQIEKQAALQKYRHAQHAAEAAQQRADLLSQMAGTLPESAFMSQLEGQLSSLISSQARLSHAKGNLESAQNEVYRADTACQQHPLYPADAAELEQRQSALAAPEPPTKAWWLCALLIAVAAAVSALLFAGTPAFHLWAVIGAGILFCSGIGGILYYVLRRRKVCRQIADIAEKKRALAKQIADYLPLQNAAAAAKMQLTQVESVYHELYDQHQQDTAAFLAQIRHFQSSACDLPSAQIAIDDLRRKQQALSQAQKESHDATLRCQIMAEHLPAGPYPDPDEELPLPTISHEEIQRSIPQLTADMQTVRTQIDTLQGQICALGDPTHLVRLRQRKAEQLTQLQAEYDALQMAMDALSNANITLQNRFSPALGARAAEIFSAITAGRYHKVLLNRDFSLSAETSDDITSRQIQLLSQGVADQLYLAVRLAICDMVLPQEKHVPLILDDALLSFDEQRLHAALDYLLEESKTRQIILFSCQKREQAYLSDREGVHCLSL